MSASAARTIEFTIRGPIGRGDLPGLCDRVCALLAGGDAAQVRCDVSGVPVDAVTVDALARLALAARRRGTRVMLCHAAPELRELIAFMGLRDVYAERPLADSRAGSPNSGKTRSVSRKNVNSTMRPSAS